MVLYPDQESRLSFYYKIVSKNPSEEECEVLGGSLIPQLTSSQVYQWFSSQSANSSNGTSIHLLTEKDRFNKFYITPPVLDQDMMDSIESNSMLSDSQATEETEIDLKSKLVSLLPTGSILSESTLIAFGRIMNIHSKNLSDIVLILSVIENSKKNPQILNLFVTSKLFKVLCNMKQVVLESNNFKIQELFLDVFMVLPFDLKIFNELKIPKYFKQKWKGRIKDKRLNDKLNCLFNKWTTASRENRVSIVDEPSNEKRLKIGDRVYVKPIVKKPGAKSTIFSQLQSPKRDEKDSHRITDLLSGKTGSSIHVASTRDFPNMPSYKGTASPLPMKEETISEKTGKPKKRVQFNVEKLDSTVFFLMDDRPNKISGSTSSASNTSEKVGDPLSWQTPSRKKLVNSALSLPSDLHRCAVNSAESKSQELREKTSISAVYVNPKHIPISPAEPTITDLPHPAEPIKWKLNKTSEEEILIDEKVLSVSPFLSALMGQPTQPAWTPIIAATKQYIPNQQQKRSFEDKANRPRKR